MQQGDYNSYYHLSHHSNPNPNNNPTPTEFYQPPYASAPPFTPDYSVYPPNYDTVPPTAPSYAHPPSLPPLDSQSSFHQQPIAPPQLSSAAPSFPPYDSHVSYQPPPSQPPCYQPHDHHQTASGYGPPPKPDATPNRPYNFGYDNSMKFDFGGGCNGSRPELGSDYYGKGRDTYSRYDDDNGGYGDDCVYAYQGGKVEPYGAHGMAPKSSNHIQFDDYGRSINFSSGNNSSSQPDLGSAKIVKAVPKAETQQDVKSGVQKFRVKLLSEDGTHGPMDALCQIGLDGIRMLDPNTGRTLRIYPLENVKRCEVMDSSTFAFWSKSPVDYEQRRIRLQSNSYTTNTLLDLVTAATVQIKEMGGSSRLPESQLTAEQLAEKKRGFGDWMNMIKPGIEEKDHWVPDEAVSKCTACATDFGAFLRKHHCRNCGDIFCDKCTRGRIALTADEDAQPVRVCDRCMAEVTRRLSNAKEAASKPNGLKSHEDLARKLQEEMEKNHRASSGSKSDGSGRRIKEVACPTCTVHLQVQVPSSGSETIECAVCQHPFLVSAH